MGGASPSSVPGDNVVCFSLDNSLRNLGLCRTDCLSHIAVLEVLVVAERHLHGGHAPRVRGRRPPGTPGAPTVHERAARANSRS